MWLPLLASLALGSPQDPGLAARQDSPPTPESRAPGSFDDLLRKQPFFKKILWTTDASFAPFEILIQKQAVPEPGFENAVAEFHGPWLAQVAQQFERRVAKPALLLPGGDPRPVRLVVLLSEGDYVNYSKTVQTWDGFDAVACYDERIRAVVARQDATGSPSLRRYQVLRRFVTALLHQRSTAVLGRQGPLWLREGLGRFLAWHVGNDPATAFAAPGTDPQFLDLVLGIAQDPARQNRYLLPLETLAAVTSYGDLRKRSIDSANAQGFAFSEQDPWYGAYLAESALWVEFLLREGAAEHNAAFGAYLRAGQRGGGSPADLKAAFGSVELSALDREFFRWAAARYRDTRHKPFDDAQLATLFVKPPPAAPASSAPNGRAANAVPPASLPPLAERLALPTGDLRIVRALALRKAAAGDVEGAESDVAAALAEGGDDADQAGLRAELERLRAWRGARDAWLGELARSGGRLQLEKGGKSVSRKVVGFDAGVVTLESPQGQEQLVVLALAPAALAAQMKTTPAGAPEWVRAFAWILGGDPRWEKQLRDKSEAAQALRADATAPNGAYLQLQKLGAAAAQLAALAAAPVPESEPEARSVLDSLAALARTSGGHPLVDERRGALRELAAVAAEVLHGAKKPGPEFSGATNWIDADTVEILYEFASAAELGDWVQRPLTPEDRRFSMEPLTIPEDQRKFVVQDGAWVGRGHETLEHRIPFEAPLHVEVVLRHGFAERDDIHTGYFVVGICSDAERGYLAFAEVGESFLEEFPTGRSVLLQSSNRATGNLGDPIRLEIAHDGTEARFVHLGTEEPRLPKHSLRAGGIFLISKTDRVLMLDSVKIRGKLNADSRAQLRARWVERTVQETGL